MSVSRTPMLLRANNNRITIHDLGANLALGLLTHLIRPHPKVDRVNLQGNLRGLYTVSARTINIVTADSFRRNASKDIISAKFTKWFTDEWKPTDGEIWGAPQLAETGFWEHVPAERVLLLAGSDECYVDDNRIFAQKFGAVEEAGASRQLIVAAGEFHDQCVLELGAGIDDGNMMRALDSWLADLAAHPVS